ncbi:hypothetical protein CAP36_13990 [Chitinophagaceae bacterium IBVUCB2]|nr:hypothetical protein CAP36_13990 [Chitinophagaceae bacterium IBVUCB2]
MKLLLLCFVTLLMTLCANSQVQFNIFAGPQVSTANYSVQGVKQDTKMKYGFQAGVGAKVVFEEKLSFSPAVFYSMKGYKVNFTQFVLPPSLDAADNNTTIHTFEMAFLLQYDFSNEPGHVFIKAGPGLDFQLFGKETFNSRTGGATVSRNMKFSYGDYGRYSANAHLQLGYETSGGFIIAAQYTHGLASINNADYGPQIKHRVFGLSIGKFLNRKKIVIDTRNKE